MRILLDARMYGLEHAGIGRYVMSLIKELQRIDQENHYLILLRKNQAKKLETGNWKLETKVVDLPHYSVSEQLILPTILAKEKFDLVHFPHFNVPLFFNGPFVVTIHDLIKHTSRGSATTTKTPQVYWLKYLGYRLVFANAVRRAKKILVPSRWVKEELAQNYPIQSNKVVITYEGVDEMFRQIANSKQQLVILKKYKIQKPFLIYAGSAYPHKNLERLIGVVKRLGIRLVIVSARTIFRDRLEESTAKLGAQQFVRFLGFVSDEELAVLYREAAAFVFPTLSEGFGLPGLEAMAVGTPVVCSDIPVLREVYGEAALYFNPRDSADIAKKIKQILTDKKLWLELLVKGKKQAKKYSWRKLAEETLKVYKEAAAS